MKKASTFRNVSMTRVTRLGQRPNALHGYWIIIQALLHAPVLFVAVYTQRPRMYH